MIMKKIILIKESNIATETVLLKYCLRIKLIVAIWLLYIYKGTMYNTTIIPPKKCFERLVKAHITSSLHTTLSVERSTDDSIATALQLCYPGSSGKEKQLCADAVHRLQLCFRWQYKTVVGLISNDDDPAYREEVHQLINWWDSNSLQLNVTKTK